MQGKWHKSIFALTILFGALISSTALGSHLGVTHPSGPPQIHHPRQVQKYVAPTQKTRASRSSLRQHPDTLLLTRPRPLTTSIETKKKPAQSPTKLGWRFLLKGQAQAAMSAYQKALRQNPQSAKAYLGLGISLKNLGKIGLAKKALLKAVNLNPRLPSALVHLGYLYAEGHFGTPNPSTARRLFKEAAQLGDRFAAIALLDLKSDSTL